MVLGAIADLAPNPFGGFAPFPNSIMIPFMGTQSAVLGYQFGLNYEAGKRMVKSMTNEDFNKLVRDKETFNISSEGKPQLLLDHLANTHWMEQMKNFQQNIPSALILQDNIIEASVAIELKKANRTPSAMVEIIQAFAQASGNEVVENMDKLPESERNFIIVAVPMLGLIYSLTKFGSGQTFTPPTTEEPPFTLEHTQIIGHEQHPQHPGDPISEPAPEPAPITEQGYPYNYSYGVPSDTGWRWDISRPVDISTRNITDLLSKSKTGAIFVRNALQAAIDEPLPGGQSAARQNVNVWNMFTFRTAHHIATGNWI